MQNLHLLSHITAQAVVPEQLVAYVQAVGDCKVQLFGNYAGYIHNNSLVLIAYAPTILHENNFASINPSSAYISDYQTNMNTALNLALSVKNLQKITILSPVQPVIVPATAQVSKDMYWGLKLPNLPPKQKLRNMLTRAKRDIFVKDSIPWSNEHADLVNIFCKTRHLETGTKYIFHNLEKYVYSECDVITFSAYNKVTNKLEAFALADFSSMSTAFYMFAFRDTIYTPGANDLLLDAICNKGILKGHNMLNLGLGINKGISFFKNKWQAQELFPYIQMSWMVTKKNWWSAFIS